ncbi:MAG: TetR/AcrR family transcriptional regulator [Myxococcota bacterium]|nr:TetR/AcrR family transcriptional regulator [Myxococcota bacterium]
MGQDDKRRRILDAAVTVFARSGFYTSKVADVASEAGVADGTIYLYFKNKEDLLIQVFMDTMERVLHRQDEALAGCVDPIEQLRRFITVHFEVAGSSPALAEVITVELRQSAKFMRATEMKPFGRYLGIIARIVAEGQEKGVFRRDIQPRFVARALFGMLDELALEWATSEQEQEMTDLRGQAVSVVLGGLLGTQEHSGQR